MSWLIPRARTSQRGSLLVAALMLFSILIALGLGLMSSQAARMRLAQSQTGALQAKALCQAAWEDVRVKLGKDILLPRPAVGQSFFAYSEDVYHRVGGQQEYFGSYTVVIDLTLNAIRPENTGLGVNTDVDIPEGILQITCIGKVGPRTQEPEAERVMYYELDMTTYNVIRVEDRSSL